MNMHSAPVLSKDGFWHECGVHIILSGNLFDRDTICHGLIRHPKPLIKTKIYLMLAWGDFMMAVFHINTHILQGEDGISPEVAAHVKGSRVKVSSPVEYLRALVVFEIEIFKLRPYIICVSLFSDLGQEPFKDIAGVAFVWSAVRVKDITEHPRNRPVPAPPWHKLKRGRIRFGNHIAFLYPRKAFDGRTIKPHSLGQTLFKFGWGDCEALKKP